MRSEFQGRRRVPRRLCIGAALLAILPVGCQTDNPSVSIDVAVYRRAEVDRVEQLEAHLERLQADLRQAEEALVLAESGLRGSYSRANAVSSLAEAKIQVERAASLAPWRSSAIGEARGKLEEAANQVQQGHFGAALFFVYRASRIAELLEREATMVRDRPGTLYVRAGHVNLRAGPSTATEVVGVLSSGTPVFPERTKALWMLVRVASGSVGWVHRDLLRSE